MCLGVFLLGFILYGTLCDSWTWLTVSFSMLGKFSTTISSKIFSVPFFFSSFSGTPIAQILVCLILPQWCLRLSSILFIPFPLFCSSAVISTILSSSSLIRSSASVILLLVSSRVLLEKAMAPHSSILAWKIPGTGEPGGLPSMGSHRVRHDWCDLAAAAAEYF